MALYPLPTNLKLIFFFDCVSATLWFCCLVRLLILLPLVGRRFLPGGIADFFHVVALLPLFGFFVVNSLGNRKLFLKDAWSLANGIRMAWICYGVIFAHPKIAKHTSYSILILSYCLSNFIHFSYLAFRTKTRSSPWLLFWLQYTHHYITFPLTMGAEMVLIFLSLAFVAEDSIYEVALKAVLLAYVPIGYLAFNYLGKRRKERYTQVMKKRIQARNSAANSTVPTAAVSTSGVAGVTESHELRELN
ncbi:predicted protein [Scheffersomyces stipitis CBS 6054]|uniref:very-long-chain (3R)-3-hydroxyacyl-CoA dehydratase n=1 Tax=Scheffersomyces stipitis (strain ATCC 58785 / CBS 6054 / NBRC 10063 / NRRL Y-11545) TaxID=322104 RepID=A3M032_PICST|nr:predicted protein [Scheffersomyces stipitis CBS 6054]ABN68642.2 predicted protein [Scheffersomyces stipitis CBS 6054]